MILELAGFAACAVIGISLGLIGAGGSILTMPVLVFMFHIPPILATTYSLFIVGITSLLGTVMKFRKGDVLPGVVLSFGLLSMLVVCLIRRYLLPAVPTILCQMGSLAMTYNWLSMVVFALLMMLAAWLMIRRKDVATDTDLKPSAANGRSVIAAFSVGTVTGLLGAGGGFILIPALTLQLRLNMKKAVGTSLAVIFLNCLVGFFSDTGRGQINWVLLSGVTLTALVGCITGTSLSRHIQADRLKIGFGWFVLILGIFILLKQGSSIINL